jgi:hypothetical protein
MTMASDKLAAATSIPPRSEITGLWRSATLVTQYLPSPNDGSLHCTQYSAKRQKGATSLQHWYLEF